MRKQVENMLDSVISKCQNMKQLRLTATKQSALVDAVTDSLSSVKILIPDTIRHLTLKGKLIEVFPLASVLEIEDVWNRLHCIDKTLKCSNKYQKGSLSSHPLLGDFLSHCCQQRLCILCEEVWQY